MERKVAGTRRGCKSSRALREKIESVKELWPLSPREEGDLEPAFSPKGILGSWGSRWRSQRLPQDDEGKNKWQERETQGRPRCAGQPWAVRWIPFGERCWQPQSAPQPRSTRKVALGRAPRQKRCTAHGVSLLLETLGPQKSLSLFALRFGFFENKNTCVPFLRPQVS